MAHLVKNLSLVCASWVVILIVASKAHAERKATETLLAPFPKEVRDSAVLSPDARRVAYVRTSGGKQTVALDGTGQSPFDRVAALTFSPDSRWLAYAASEGDQWHMVAADRKEGPFERVGRPVFSPDSQRVAYVAMRSDGARAVRQVGQAEPAQSYEWVLEGRIVFSPDSKRLAFGARIDGKWYLIVDGERYGPYDFLGSATGIHFSADGSAVAFAAWIDKKWCVVVDGEKGPPFDNVGDLAFSPIGKRIAYTAQEGQRWKVIVDGRPWQKQVDGRLQDAAYDAVGEGKLTFSPDGRHVACAVQSGEKWAVAVDGREFKPYDGVAEMRFSPNSAFIAYTVRLGEAEMVVVNNREQKLYDRIGGGTLVFSSNSERLGYLARVGAARETVAVVGGEPSRPWDMAAYLNFSPDNRHYAYAAIQGDRAFTVVDQEPSPNKYDSIWNPPDAKLMFDSPTSFHYLAVKDDDIYLVEERFE